MARSRACVLPLVLGACAAPADKVFRECMRDMGYNASR